APVGKAPAAPWRSSPSQRSPSTSTARHACSPWTAAPKTPGHHSLPKFPSSSPASHTHSASASPHALPCPPRTTAKSASRPTQRRSRCPSPRNEKHAAGQKSEHVAGLVASRPPAPAGVLLEGLTAPRGPRRDSLRSSRARVRSREVTAEYGQTA